MSRAAEIALGQGGELGQDEGGRDAVIVRCVDCRHAARYTCRPTVGWCLGYRRERELYFIRE